MLPGPTQKNVTPADIVGVWEYPADNNTTVVTLDLKADGSFVQSIARAGDEQPQVHQGEWKLDGATPELTVLRPVFAEASQPWILEEVNWWVVDSQQGGLTFAICGSADDRDPDSYWEFEKIE